LKNDNDPSWRPRISVEITPESYNKMQKILPHGWQRPLFQALTNGIIELYARGGIDAIAAIVAGHIKTEQIAQVGFKIIAGDD